ncbi:hypothetical protein AB0M43_23655 [Longispora sp. NPDC051575]|uniref:hypothetical protein n=1 Tax=Longispora sp. NPDC051575 TaxID=3154943 RepID=UPI0034280F37
MKPEYFADEDIADLSRDARLLYIGLWGLADEHSRLRGDPRWIKGQIFAYDDDLGPGDVGRLIDELEKLEKAIRYHVDGRTFLFLPTLARHQRLDTDKVPSRLPALNHSNFGSVTPTSRPTPARPDPAVGGVEPSTDQMKTKARPSEPVPTLSESVSEKSEKFPDEIEKRTTKSAPMQVAGGKDQGAGNIGARADSGTPPDRIDAEAEEICRQLAAGMAANGCRVSPTASQGWRRAAKAMLTDDHRDLDEVLGVIRWSMADGFWRSHVLSVPKLRQKFDQLRLASQRGDPRDATAYRPFTNPPSAAAYEGSM